MALLWRAIENRKNAIAQKQCACTFRFSMWLHHTSCWYVDKLTYDDFWKQRLL